MKTINFSETGVAISDYKISEWVDNMINSTETEFNVSTHLVIHEIRARVKEGSINPDEVIILIEGETFLIDRDGRSSEWRECQEIYSNILMRLL